MRIVALGLIIISGCSCAQGVKRLDPQSAIQGNDLTALMSTGEEQVSVGYLVSRQLEGANAATQYVIFHAPPQLECDEKEGCLYFKIFFPDGRPTYQGLVKKGESTATVPWSMIINKSLFDPGTRGLYGVSVTLHYKGINGEPMKSYSDGYLFLHVVKKDYISLLENEEDEHFVWSWKTKQNQTLKMTTGCRVYVSPSAGQGHSKL